MSRMTIKARIVLHAVGYVGWTLLASCAVGPDFKAPAAPNTPSYTHEKTANKTASIAHAGTAGNTQYLELGQDISATWWELFHSQTLDQLILRGLKNNQTVVAAKAALRAAEETLSAETGVLLTPSVVLNGQDEEQQFNIGSLGLNQSSNKFNLYNVNVGVSYILDIWGGQRRQVEQYRAKVDYKRYEWIAAYLTLESNISTTAITVASLEAQVAAMQDLIAAEERLLQIFEQQLKLGGVSDQNIFSQESTLATAQANLPPLEKRLAQEKNALAVLLGELPSEANLPHLALHDFVLPSHIPLSIPSQLVAHRPDVQQAEALLHEACAGIGVATANMLPQIKLTGAYGISGTGSSGFSSFSDVWSVAAGLSQVVFNGGALWSYRQMAIEQYKTALAQYKQTVLQAFQNVADSLRAIEEDAKLFERRRLAEVATHNAWYLTKQQHHLGGASYSAVLSAEAQYQEAHIQRILAETSRYTDTVALFQSLGGGWWNHNKGSIS
ncbi:MAG: hypothetical protein A3J38_00055 [Gammaproteobacteria bacterium RIFCSPHIGHO2_12_FULL_45_9]|nr:MAG: hypothetical protein A3J38_00055 [Gammaproteobacteria bacterium RIFCSPHIGHO2_12_FULL_45_9]